MPRTPKPAPNPAADILSGVRVAPPGTADSDECPKCHDYGFIINADNVAVPCDCGLTLEVQRQERFARAGIPARFLKKTFDSYEVPRGDKQRQALVGAARAYASHFEPGHVGGMILRGKPGSGKTHIAVAILKDVMARGHSGYFCGFSDLLKTIQVTFREGAAMAEGDVLGPIYDSDLVVLDDLGAEKLSEWVTSTLYQIINRRYEANRAVIITTNCDDALLEARFGERTVSRLYEMCEGRPLRFPDEDWRRAMMR